MPPTPDPRRVTPNDPTQFATPPGEATEPLGGVPPVLGPATTPSTLPSGPGLKPANPGALQQLGNYCILEPLGEGGMSLVFKAYHAGLDRFYALKVMQASPQMPGGPIERFLREARSLARIGKHPYIVQVHDVGNESGHYYLAMDLVEGGALDCRLDAGPLFPRDAARIARQVAEALTAAHEAGVIHRDLKPSNILLDAAGVPHVSDFGLARDMNAGVRLSQEGDVLGTPLYMAPEQIEGTQDRIGPATDVYGLGATLYEMLTGQPPFPGDNSHAIMVLATTTEPTPLSQVNPAVPLDLETICLKAIQKRPEDRYATPREMGEDLDRFLRGEPVRARPVSIAMRLARRAAKHRAIAALLLLIAAALISWGCLRAIDSRRASRALDRADSLAAASRWSEARSAYLEALKLDPGDRVARAGLDRADAEARREGSEGAARHALEQARRVQDVLARWMALSGTLRELERAFHTTRMSVEERRAAAEPHWRAVEAFMQATPADDTSQAAMRALAGWARRLAGHEDEGRDWMRQADAIDADLPYGAFIEALSCLAPYVAQQPLPQIYGGDTGLHFGPVPPETPAMREMHARMNELLARAAMAKVWGEGLAQDFRKALSAMGALQEGRLEEAERALSDAIASPTMEVFRTELLFARAKTRYLLKRFAEGTADAEAVLSVWSESVEAWHFLGVLRSGAGMDATSKRKDGDPDYRKALEALDQALAREPGNLSALIGRGNTKYLMRDLEGAIVDYDAVLAIEPKESAVLLDRGNIRLLQGHDPQALADYDAAIAASPELAPAYVGRGMVRAHQDDLDGAIEAFGDALAREPDNLWALLGRGKAFRRKGDLAGATRDFDEAVKLAPRYINARQARGLVRLTSGDIEGAREDLDEVIKLAGDGAGGSGIVEDHYDLGCIYALLSTGVTRRGQAAVAPTAGRAEECRSRAFMHLSKAIELGFQDRAQLEKDDDLAPLRFDPRWKSLLR